MRAGWLGYGGWLGAVVAALALGASRWPRGAEDAIATMGARPLPTIDRIEELYVDPVGGLPGFTAATATPRGAAASSGSIVEIAGTVGALELRGVAVELGPEMVLRADSGELAGRELRVRGDLRVERDSERLLAAAAAVFAGGSVRFDGLVLFRPRGAGARTEVGTSYTLEELIAALR